MNFVCELCGTQLEVERGTDDDRLFEAVWRRHAFEQCPRSFRDEIDLRRPSSKQQQPYDA